MGWTLPQQHRHSDWPEACAALFGFEKLAWMTALVSILLGRVVAVADGDTITVLGADRQQHKIRLQGIDAPERTQPFGERSKQSLSRMVFERDVRIKWDKRDRYRRIVGNPPARSESAPTRWCSAATSFHVASATVSQSPQLPVLRYPGRSGH